jgi:hypothetical protein
LKSLKKIEVVGMVRDEERRVVVVVVKERERERAHCQRGVFYREKNEASVRDVVDDAKDNDDDEWRCSCVRAATTKVVLYK